MMFSSLQDIAWPFSSAVFSGCSFNAVSKPEIVSSIGMVYGLKAKLCACVIIKTSFP